MIVILVKKLSYSRKVGGTDDTVRNYVTYFSAYDRCFYHRKNSVFRDFSRNYAIAHHDRSDGTCGGIQWIYQHKCGHVCGNVVIGAGLTKTSLIDKAEQLVVRYKDNPKMLIFLACIASSLLASITSATATAAIMISLLVGIANEIGTSRSKLLYPAMACANIATSMTFLGQGASNITWIDIMAKAGAPNELYIWDFTIARIPLLVVSILYMTFVGYKLMPDIDNNTFVDGGHTGRKSAKLSPIKEKIAIIIIVVTILAMLFESVIGIPMYIVACIGAVLLVLSGILNEKEALDSIHQPTIFLFAGVLTLSEAIKITGAGDVVADWMISLIGNTTNPYLIMAVFFLIPFLLTQIMSNLATLTIFIPLVVSACMKIGIDPRAAVVGVLTASCISIMTPMAAPCQIMIIEPGGYTLKDYLKCGTPLAVILAIMTIFLMPLMFPFY